MRIPAATIWDTKVQSVCAAVAAYDADGGVELWLCANFGVATTDPLRLIVNPNRLYPIDTAIQTSGRFSVNIFSSDQAAAARRLFRTRRRSPIKDKILGVPVLHHAGQQVPYLQDCLTTFLCQVEQSLDTGDHRLVIAQVREKTDHTAHAGKRPLLYPELNHPGRGLRLVHAARMLLKAVGAEDFARRLLKRRRTDQKPNLPENTYWQGGASEPEVSKVASYGLADKGRICWPPETPPAILRRSLCVCVAGVGKWGMFHCSLLRQASPNVQLIVCGRDRDRTERIAHRTGAAGYIVGWENAVQDPRIQAMSIVLPHDLHAEVAMAAAAAGKHVLVEKPIANTLSEADAMIESARRAGTILMVAENMHFRPAVREAVRVIEAGDIGEPLFLQVHGGGIMRPSGWQADAARMGGGIFMDMGIHYVRVLRLIMGEPDSVLLFPGMQVHTKMSGEDNAQAVFSSSAGWRSHFYLNWAGPTGHSPDVIVSGEKGVLLLWRQEKHLDLYPAEATGLASMLPLPAWLAHKLSSPARARIPVPFPDDDLTGYVTEVKEFLAAIEQQRPALTPPEDGRRDLEIVLAAYRSLQSGRAEPIPKPPQRHPSR
ncbi:MAG: Gfo/Idh/MocA family oxidoreductase [Bryobacterales bacterium]|nr:Gfo/Idh/MocA family oxidoreductase [Bryobacterales bacterium]